MTVLRRALALGAAATLVACSGSGGTGPASPGGSTRIAPAGNTVEVKDFSFAPGTLRVAPGTRVTWRFEDDAEHNVDIRKGTVQSPNRHAGQSYSYTFTTPGTYDYVCSIHQYMTGRIVVK